MAKICYRPQTFKPVHAGIIETANDICEEYRAQNLVLTLRQLYYQFVARDFLPNKQSEYKRLGVILNDARMAGAMDWDFLIDRTRNLVKPSTWDSPADLIKSATKQYRTDLWKAQHERVVVFIEKDAAIGVIESVCDLNSIPYFSCRGYTSVSELWSAAQRIRYDIENGDRVTILHIGDHDPSGLDMTRDIDDRLRLFITKDWCATWGQNLSRPVTVADIKASMRTHMRNTGGHISDYQTPWRILRIALNYDQVLQYEPPPNPAKTTDTRFLRYVQETGLDDSWELDALDPIVLQNLIQDEIDAIRDEDLWAESNGQMEEDRELLTKMSDNWDAVSTFIKEQA